MKTKYLLLAVFFLGCLLRFWQLGANPSSLDWDEASLGYNAYSILHTGRDEYGTFLPLSIRSFGDFKPALYTYLSIAPIAAFGLNEFSVRFISALLGSFTVLICFFLALEIAGRKQTRFALLSSFFLAISPWHIQFSRIAFESNVSVFFVVVGIWLLLAGMCRRWLWILSSLSLGLSLYAYHSPRLIVPLLLMGIAYLYRRTLWQNKKWAVIAAVILACMAVPIIREMTSTSARFGSVSIINPAERLGDSIARTEYDQAYGDRLGALLHNRRIVYGRDILAGYLDHWNIDFLFLTGDAPGRHHASGMGMLYWWDALLVPLGMAYLFSRRRISSLVIFIWYFLAPTASAVTSGTPHAVRALLFLPTYQLFSAAGVMFLRGWYARRSTLLKYVVLGVAAFFFFFNFYYYLSMYWIHAPVEYAKEWQYGYKQAVEIARSKENEVDQIIVTYRYDQPYVYFLFYNQVDPAWYQQQWQGGDIERFNRNFGKYEFRNLDWEKDKELTNVILVGTPGEIPDTAEGKIADIFFPDGSTAFRIVHLR